MVLWGSFLPWHRLLVNWWSFEVLLELELQLCAWERIFPSGLLTNWYSVALNTFSGVYFWFLRPCSSLSWGIPLSSSFLVPSVWQSCLDPVCSTSDTIVAAFWLSYATTLTPFYNAATAYDATNPENPGFYNAYGQYPNSGHNEVVSHMFTKTWQ